MKATQRQTGRRALTRAALAITAAISLAPPARSDSDNALEAFETFAAQTFGAEAESLVYQAFGTDLQFEATADWIHPSLNSAAVAFKTVLPARAFVEYGTSDAYGSATAPAARYFALHLAYLKGLEPDRVYHYRLVATDERGNQIVSADRTFRTLPDEGLVKIPGDLAGPPYQLAGGQHYVLTQDLTADHLAIDIPQNAAGITLDLNGHTIVYNNVPQPPIESGNFWDWIHGAAYGIRAMRGANSLRVFNGTIRQGAGRNAAQGNSIGYSPIYTTGCGNMEFAGLTIAYEGPQVVGINHHWSGAGSRMHHNRFVDAGTELINRHGAGSRALLMAGSGNLDIVVDHNRVDRTRQSGLSGDRVHDNEIYVDSWATNSFGIGLDEDGHAWNNRVFGTGYHFVGIGWANGIRVRDNFIHAQAEPVPGRFDEYGDQSSVNGLRLTQYSGATRPFEHNRYTGNFIAVYARGGTQARGVQFFSDPHVRDLGFSNNVVKAIAQDTDTSQVACIVTQGLHDRADTHEPIFYIESTLISNICNIRFGDYYGVGSNHRFTGCTLIREGTDARYRTFVFDTGYPSFGHRLLDGRFEQGADPFSVQWPGGTAENSRYGIAWTLSLQTVPGADVSVFDLDGAEVFQGQADAAGRLTVPLLARTAKKSGDIPHTPHRVEARTADGRTFEAEVTLNEPKHVNLTQTQTRTPETIRTARVNPTKDMWVGKDRFGGTVQPFRVVADEELRLLRYSGARLNSLIGGFELPPFRSVQNATLHFYVITGGGDSASRRVYPVTMDWHEAMTAEDPVITANFDLDSHNYGEMTGGFSSTGLVERQDVFATDTWENMDVTVIVQNWLSGQVGSPEKGIVLRESGPWNATIRLGSLSEPPAPYIEITGDLPPARTVLMLN